MGVTLGSENLDPRSFIECVRREKFGLGPGGRLAAENPLVSDLKNALTTLARDLYSKETHFVFELIQNADDNLYEAGISPELRLSYLEDDATRTPEAEGALLVVNNEKGLRPEDVRALCAVGETTKGDRAQGGYIGEKGIGFKSVFQVSERPHFFSNGYQFRFQEKDEAIGLGYIVPYWVEEVPDIVRQYRGHTCILLPLKPGKADKIASYLRDVAPETILFLNKLETLIVDGGRGQKVEVRRDRSQEPLVALWTNGDQSLYWVARKTFAIPKDLEEEKRKELKETTVSIALPLSGGAVQGAGCVFAYLPTEVDSGLPFVVNADFILSASREAIQIYRPWNQWLRDCIPEVFLGAFEVLISDRERREQAYQFIPLLKEVRDEFFKPVAETILDELKKRPVVWTVVGDRPVLPSEARLCPKDVRDLFVREQLPDPLREQAKPVLPGMERHGERLRAIGVQEVSDEEVLACLRDEAWLQRQRPAWFADLYKHLSGYESFGWEQLRQLRESCILPMQEGGLVSAESASVFFPTHGPLEIEEYETALRPEDLGFKFLHKETSAEIRKDKKVLDWVDRVLGLREATLENQVLAAIEFSQRAYEEESATERIVKATRFIRDRCDKLPDECKEEITSRLAIIFDKQCATERDWGDWTHVLPVGLDPETGWQMVFPNWRHRTDLGVISDEYLNPDTEEERRRWESFWLALFHPYVTDAPDPETQEINRCDRNLTPHQQDVFREIRHCRLLEDNVAPSWLSALTYGMGSQDSPEVTERRCHSLLKWLQRNLKKNRGCPSWAHMAKWIGSSKNLLPYESEFLYCLKNAPWFPSTKGLKRPSEVFLDKPEIRDIFGDTAPYALGEVDQKVVEFLGLRTSISTEELLILLRDWSQRPSSEVDKELVAQIYHTLSARNVAAFADRFRQERLIFVPGSDPAWLSSEQVIWPDLSSVFGDTFVYLEPHYPKLRSFFTEGLGVAAKVGEEEYAKAWLRLTEQKDLSPDRVEPALEEILERLVPIVRREAKPEWWEDFKARVKVWGESVSGKGFVSPQEVFVPDDPEYREIARRWGVWFAWMPRCIPFPKVLALYRALGARVLSEEVTVELAGLREEAQPWKARFLTPEAKGLIVRKIWAEDQEAYRALRESGLLESLLHTEECEAPGLRLRVRLHWREEERESRTFWDTKMCRLFVDDRNIDGEILRGLLAEELCRHLLRGVQGLDLRDFVHKSLTANEERAEHFRNKEHLTLPDEEKAWMEGIFEEAEQGIPAAISGEPQPSPPMGPAPIVSPVREDQARKRRRQKERLRSYVEPSPSGEDWQEPSEVAAEEETVQQQIERVAIEFVLEWERRAGRLPRERQHSAPGWDIDSHEWTEDGQERLARLIEVKALSGEWDEYDIGLTQREFWEARDRGDKYYLYVVEHALDPSQRRLYIIQGPAVKANEFRFDGEWKKVAEGPQGS